MGERGGVRKREVRLSEILTLVWDVPLLRLLHPSAPADMHVVVSRGHTAVVGGRAKKGVP
jgi:hypothetical protein